ncbi:MAG: hypothetical protein PVF43_06570 [Candidatus Eiseniibacteriota bacterium]|jgi:hypothetical protein
MDFAEYRRKYFVDPAPSPRFAFEGSFNVALFIEDYEAAIDYYTGVLGPPAYVEGAGTRSWPIGRGWLTLLRGKAGAPRNVEILLAMETPEEAERLQAALIAAGGTGPAPSDQLMHRPIRSCPLVDPFGTELQVIAPLP